MASWLLHCTCAIHKAPKAPRTGASSGSSSRLSSSFRIGLFNIDIHDLRNTSLVPEMKGVVIATYQPIIDSGGCVDYAITSRSMAAIVDIQDDWTAPIKPHAAIVLTVHESLTFWLLPQLKGFQGDCKDEQHLPAIIADVPLLEDSMTLAFQSFSLEVEADNQSTQTQADARGPTDP